MYSLWLASLIYLYRSSSYISFILGKISVQHWSSLSSLPIFICSFSTIIPQMFFKKAFCLILYTPASVPLQEPRVKLPPPPVKLLGSPPPSPPSPPHLAPQLGRCPTHTPSPPPAPGLAILSLSPSLPHFTALLNPPPNHPLRAPVPTSAARVRAFPRLLPLLLPPSFSPPPQPGPGASPPLTRLSCPPFPPKTGSPQDFPAVKSATGSVWSQYSHFPLRNRFPPPVPTLPWPVQLPIRF